MGGELLEGCVSGLDAYGRLMRTGHVRCPFQDDWLACTLPFSSYSFCYFSTLR